MGQEQGWMFDAFMFQLMRLTSKGAASISIPEGRLFSLNLLSFVDVTPPFVQNEQRRYCAEDWMDVGKKSPRGHLLLVPMCWRVHSEPASNLNQEAHRKDG